MIDCGYKEDPKERKKTDFRIHTGEQMSAYSVAYLIFVYFGCGSVMPRILNC